MDKNINSSIKDIFKYPMVIIFAVFIMVLFLCDIIKPDKVYSENENKKLAQFPTFSWSKLFKNEYTLEYEKYVNDQFVLRDNWIALKSMSELALGKIENNGVAYGKDDYLFNKSTKTEDRTIKMNNGFVNDYINKNAETHITFGLIPNSYDILKDKLPIGMENILINQKEQINNIYREIKGDNLSKLDLYSVMEKNRDNGQIYYRTDHHWTTEGAYQAYKTYMESLGLKYAELSELEQYKHTVPGFLGTYYSKSKNFNVVTDNITYYDVPVTSVTIEGKKTVKDQFDNEVTIDNLYMESMFDKRDKYAAFLYGNHGLTIIKSDNNKNKAEGKTSRILVFKDSYSNCFVPFLTYSFDEVYVVDLRSHTPTNAQILKRVKMDEILIMFNFESYQNESNFTRLGL